MHVIIFQFKMSITSYNLWMFHQGSQELYSNSQSIQSSSKSLYVQPQLCQPEHYKYLHHSQATIPKIPLRGIIMKSDHARIARQHLCPIVQNSLYSQRFFFPKFPHQLFLRQSQSFQVYTMNLYWPAQLCQLRVSNKSINKPMNFQNLPFQSACLLPTVQW